MKTKTLLLIGLLFCIKSYTQTWQWTHPESNNPSSYNNYDDDVPKKITSDNAGDIYELGDYNTDLYLGGIYRTTGTGSFIAKYNAAGKLLWYKVIKSLTNGGSIKGGDIAVLNDKLFFTGNYKTGAYDQNCSPVQNYTYSIGDYSFSTGLEDMGMFYATLDLNGNVLSNLKANGLRAPCLPVGAISNPPLLAVTNNNVYIAFDCRIYGSVSYFSIGPYPIYCGYVSNPYGCKNIVVVKCDASGFITWSNIGYDIEGKSNDDNVKSITADNNGSVFINCRLDDNMQFGNLTFHTSSIYNASYGYYSSSVLIKISKTGEWKFIKEIANVTAELDPYRCENLTTDAEDNVYMTVSVLQNWDKGPGVILGDTLPHPVASDGAMCLVKLDNAGNPIWKKYFGKNPYKNPPSAAGGYADNIIFLGNRLYVSGAIRGDNSSSFLFSGLTVPGTTCGPVSSQWLQYFVAQADTDGNFQWVTTICGGLNTQANSIYARNGNVYSCGNYRISVNNLGHLNGSFINPNSVAQNAFLGRLKDQYLRIGSLSSKQVLPGCSINIPFTSTGLTFSAANHMVAELSDVNGSFTSPVAIGDVKSTGSGIIKAVLPATLAVGTQGYRVRIRSTDTLLTGFNYYAYADTGYSLTIACPAAPSGLATNNITGTSATLNWNVVGCASGYKIQYRVKGTKSWTVLSTNGSTSTANIPGLTPNTIYQWRVATKCKYNGANSFSEFSPISQFTTAASIAGNGVVLSVVSEANAMKLIVQPNPAKTSAALVVNGTIKNASVIITDIPGKIMWEKTNINSNHIVLPVERFTPGIYVVKLLNGSEIHTVKLVKE